MYYPKGMKARVSPVQSIEPHRTLAPTRDSNQELLGPQSRVVTTMLPLQTTRLCVLEQEQECSELAEHALIVYATC